MRAECFSMEDRLLMAERVRKNETGLQNKQFKVGYQKPYLGMVIRLIFIATKRYQAGQ